MKILLHIFFIKILLFNACANRKSSNTSSTRPEDYSSETKNDTTNSTTVLIKDRVIQKSIDNPVSDKSNPTSENYFELISATSEDWVSGISNGGKGTEYYFKVRIVTEMKLEFDKAWINKNAFSIFISKEQSSVSSQPIIFSKNDTITLRVSHIQNITLLNIQPPFNFSGAALISFTANGKQEYFNVQVIKKLITVNRP